jgi:hypothetical protein
VNSLVRSRFPRLHVRRLGTSRWPMPPSGRTTVRAPRRPRPSPRCTEPNEAAHDRCSHGHR